MNGAYSQWDRYAIWLSGVEGIGPRRFEQLLSRYGHPQTVFEQARTGKLPAEPLGPALRKKLCERAAEARLDDFFELMQARGIRALTRENGEYPPALREIDDPPVVLYAMGKTLSSTLNIALVGARRCTGYGETSAYQLGKALAARSVTVVSGLALGVDAWAHTGALDANADFPTIAVLGSGVDVKYPASNSRLYDKILAQGAILSEYVPGTGAAAGNFPARNRIISGISQGVVVVEAGVRSGALITANCALEQGREVFAVPGRMSDAMSQGANKLVRDGAKPVFGVEDILEEFGFGLAPMPKPELDFSGLSEKETVLCAFLKEGERTFDDFCEVLGLPASDVNRALTSLEFRGIIKQLPGRVFKLSGQ